MQDGFLFALEVSNIQLNPGGIQIFMLLSGINFKFEFRLYHQQIIHINFLQMIKSYPLYLY